MTVEVKIESTQVAEEAVVPQEEALKVVEETQKVVDDANLKIVEKSSSYREESSFPSDLKEHEKKALNELKSKLEEAILGNSLFKKEEPKNEAAKSSKTEEKAKEENSTPEAAEEEKKPDETKEKVNSTPEAEEEKISDEPKPKEDSSTPAAKVEAEEEKKSDEAATEEKVDEVAKIEKGEEAIEECVEVDKDISIWGVPLLPSKGAEGTDIVLLKFLRARDFKVNEALEMLKKTLQWRKELKIDSILDEDLGCSDLASAAYMSGIDREGHPICYNIFGALDNQDLYEKTFGTEEKREQFLRWRFQLMEKGIQKLEFTAGGVNSLLQINDLKNSPRPSKKEVRVATKQAVALLQDNYPEFVARNIFINVPFWYYAFHALLSPFLTQRTNSKFLVVRPAKVTETLLKYIPIEEIPIQYGGLKRENDFEFSAQDGGVSEVVLKAGSTETIEISVPEVGTTFIWDLSVLGWEVNYKEEFVPTDENSYTIIVQKGKKIGTNQGPVRNTFRANEPGKILLTVENSSSKKKKVFYRYKVKKCSSF